MIRTLLGRTRSQLRRARGVRMGLAIAPEWIVAVEIRRGGTGPRAGRTWVRALARWNGSGEWADLADGLEELATELGACGTLDVALVRPLAWAKVVRPPPVPRRDVVPLLSRNVRRYLLTDPAAGPLAVDAMPLGRGADGALRALLACAPEPVTNAVWAAAEATGWKVGVITSATPAFAAGVVRLAPALGKRCAVVAASCDDWREGVVLDGGRLARAEAWSRLTPEEIRERAASLAAAQGGTATLITGARDAGLGGPVESAHPAAVAALGATLLARRAPLLVPASVRAAWRGAELRRIAVLAAAAACLAIGAEGLRVLGLERELAAVRAARAASAPAVRDALAARAAVDGLRARLRAIERVEGSVQPWTPVLAALARALPDSAYLLSLSARGADVRLVGLAPSASAIVPALSSSNAFDSVTFAAPVERVAQHGERFDVGASVARTTDTASARRSRGRGSGS